MADPCEPWRERLQCDGLVGRSEALAAVLAKAWTAARCDLPVLLVGPTGTGKTAVARVIHEASGRGEGPFQPVACPASPDTLFEAHLFGADAGAWTDSRKEIVGHVERAHRGTLFLDEIGDLPDRVQAKLLVLIETGGYSRLGTTTRLRSDVRFIAATNRPACLRDDVLFRLGGLPIRLPSLVERLTDVPLLAEAIVDRYARRRGEPRLLLSLGARQALLARPWPGNVRELENVLQGALEEAWARGEDALIAERVAAVAPPEGSHGGIRDRVAAFQDWLLDEALASTGGNVAEAARRLRVSVQWIYKLRPRRLRRPAA